MSDHPSTNHGGTETRSFFVIRTWRRNNELKKNLRASVSPWFVIGAASDLRWGAAA